MAASDIVLTVLFSILISIGVIGNFLVCLIIAYYRDMRSTMNYLLLNLAFADMLTVLFVSPQYIFIHSFTHPQGTTGDYLCKFITGGNLSWIGGVASVFALVSIAFERYYAVTAPYRQGFITTKTLRIIITSCWIFSILFNCPLFYAIRYDARADYCMEVWPNTVYPKINSLCWFLVVGVIPVLIMGVLYSRVVYSLWIKKDERGERTTQQGVKRVRKKVTKMVIIVSMIYAVCWFPQLTIYLLSYFSPTTSFGGLPYIISVAMVTINSAVNPVIYSLQNERFRKHLKTCVCHVKRRVQPQTDGEQHAKPSVIHADLTQPQQSIRMTPSLPS
ncbi:QRFP-like peptide receptor [Actinia tenebrosa]|uniref:QRFP-like peptide receptor n=1 Tax=Actinia tenebrosa TaxID=6105 RepID=A0A6P8J5M5_ACTTE|nr:QRFP-like peptide receptor [Actinia tenebrosa]